MGIPTDPGYDLYVPDDCHCWPPSKTPKKLFLSLSGIKTGSLWGPYDLPCPNGIWVLEYVGSCTWSNSSLTWVLSYQLTASSSAVSVVSAMFYPAFSGSAAFACCLRFGNELTDPAGYYYGGSAALIQREAV